MKIYSKVIGICSHKVLNPLAQDGPTYENYLRLVKAILTLDSKRRLGVSLNDLYDSKEAEKRMKEIDEKDSGPVGIKNPNFKPKSILVQVKNLKTNELKEYDSIKRACEDNKLNLSYVMTRFKKAQSNKILYYMIANRNNMMFINNGINGPYMNNKLYGNNKCIVDRYSDMYDDADYIIVFSGSDDDDDASVTIGSNASIDPSEFKGALNIICDGLLTKYPTNKIMFITPYLRTSKYVDYIGVIETICAKYSIRVFNNMKDGKICW